MADLTSANVTLLDHWTEGATNGKRRSALKVSAAITGAGSGGSTAKIPAVAFGLRSIEEVSPLVKSDNAKQYIATPNAAEDEVLVQAGASNAPGDVTGTFVFVVRGQPKPFNT